MRFARGLAPKERACSQPVYNLSSLLSVSDANIQSNMVKMAVDGQIYRNIHSAEERTTCLCLIIQQKSFSSLKS